ncbi:hypothetical protein ACTHPH_12455 [Paenibacillus pasadenensis]|uniref:hypothetical protein n=1 Tax=Paenibacillus pasadenensis TaxID=217090 RepID=UPI00048AEFDA|nr:hypothetical protein [Paenibacillus pasadenensis]
MRKRTKILIGTGAVIVSIGAGGAWAANLAMNKFLDSMAESAIVSTVQSGSVPKSKEETGTAIDSEKQSSSSEGSENDKKSTVEKAEDKSTQLNPEPVDTRDKEDQSSAYLTTVSKDQMNEIKEDVSLNEKMAVMSILLKRLSVSDIRKLQQLAQGTLTREKKREARTIIHEKVTPEQYDELIAIAKKYGVSQGRSYGEVIKQEERLLNQIDKTP